MSGNRSDESTTIRTGDRRASPGSRPPSSAAKSSTEGEAKDDTAERQHMEKAFETDAPAKGGCPEAPEACGCGRLS